jgi:RNA polymerase primary sigma factor
MRIVSSRFHLSDQHGKNEKDFVEQKYEGKRLFLTKEEEFEILKKYRKCKEGSILKKKLKDKLVAANWRFAKSRARKFEGILGKEVARQAAYIGLIRSFDKADLRKKSAITTVAHWWILFEMVRAIDTEVYPITIPGNTTNSVRKKIKAVNPLNEDLSDSELLKRIYGANATYKELRELLAVKQTFVPIDNVVEEGNGYNGERNISYEDENLRRCEVRKDVRKALCLLTKRERTVVINYYGLNGGCRKTMEEVGKMFINPRTNKPLSCERIRQILKKAKEELAESGVLDFYRPTEPSSKPSR